MQDFQMLFAQFKISAEDAKHLERLAAPVRSAIGRPERVVVETVIVEHGERRIVKTEERGAKLV